MDIDLPDVVARSELLIIAVPDDRMSDVVAEIVDSGRLRPRTLVVHTPGAHGVGVFVRGKNRGRTLGIVGYGNIGAQLSVVAEMLGVKSGLGWYLQWAQGWAAYANLYAALIVMALMCSGLITLLFRLRDRLLDQLDGENSPGFWRMR